MTILVEQAIDNSKVKVRWEEPYSSSAMNRFALALPKGIYSGFRLMPSAVPDTSVWLRVDDGSSVDKLSMMVFHDSQNGYGLTITETVDIELDFSSLFTDGGTPTSTFTAYLWAEVTYGVGSQTSAKYILGDAFPASGDFIKIGSVFFDTTATVLESADLSEVSRNFPRPYKVETDFVEGETKYGFLSGQEAWRMPTVDQKKALTFAASPSQTNPFVTRDESLDKVVGAATIISFTLASAAFKKQMTGVYYIGKQADDWDTSNFFELLGSYNGEPMTDSADGKRIWCRVASSDEDHLLDYNDADADGFYSNPYLYFYVGTQQPAHGAIPKTLPIGTDMFVRCTKKSDLGSVTPEDAGVSNSLPSVHASKIFADFDSTKKPHNFTSTERYANTQLGLLIDWMNSAISIQSSVGVSDAWTVVWQNTYDLTSAWTKHAVSVWGNKLGRATVKGGFLDGDDFQIGLNYGPTSPTQPVSMLLVGELSLIDGAEYDNKVGVFFGIRTTATGTGVGEGIVFDWTDLSEWEYWSIEYDGKIQHGNIRTDLDVTSFLSFQTNPSSTDLNKVFSNEQGSRKPSLMAGDGSAWISSNAEFDLVSHVMSQIDAGEQSLGIGVTESGAFIGERDAGAADWDPQVMNEATGWSKGIQWDGVQLAVNQLRLRSIDNGVTVSIGSVGSSWCGLAIIKDSSGTCAASIFHFTGATNLKTDAMFASDGTTGSVVNYWNDSGTFKVKNQYGSTRVISLMLIGMK
jgi:hypothetical protein